MSPRKPVAFFTPVASLSMGKGGFIRNGKSLGCLRVLNTLTPPNSLQNALGGQPQSQTGAIMQATFDLVSITHNRAITTSFNIAERFNKLHKDVLRSIKNLIGQIDSNWHERNFAPMQNITPTFNGGSRKDTFYEITRDGFALLAMGFTGAEALQFKIEYIDAFNAMEQEILDRQSGLFRFKKDWRFAQKDDFRIYAHECKTGRIFADYYIKALVKNPLMADGGLFPKMLQEINECKDISTNGVLIGFLAAVEEHIAGTKQARIEFNKFLESM